MKLKYLILVMVCAVGINAFGQKEVNFKHKAIQKEIRKTFDLEQVNLKPFGLEEETHMQGKFFKLAETDNKYVYIGRVNSCRAGGCSIDRDIKGPSEYFDYFILFDEKAEVKLVKIFNYAATHGHEVTSKGWLKQFLGHENGEELEVGKNIDSISGATISVYALTSDVKEKTDYLNKILSEIQNN
ncbi:FMN-binding protein [Labilibacter sediminis]|nr:FMN-binding protein [Labilibacter sediminis]